MTAREMHYEFKMRIDKVDSLQRRNFLVPQIDLKLNEAQELFIENLAMPKFDPRLGFEINQRAIDELRTIVVNQKGDNYTEVEVFDDSSFITKGLPSDYKFFLNAKVIAEKGSCVKVLNIKPFQHDDESEISPFDKSSFEWKVVNMRFISEGIRFFTDKTFKIQKVYLDYIKEPRYIHNAQDFPGGAYDKGDGTILQGSSDCELPKGTHSKIVDLAVLIAAGEINSVDYQLKVYKQQLTQ